MSTILEDLEALQRKTESMQRALEFYAEQGNWKRPTQGRKWQRCPADIDKGSRARTVLLGLGE